MAKKLTNRRLSSRKVLLAASKSQVSDAIVVAIHRGEVTVFGAPPTRTRDDYNAQINQLKDGIALLRDVRGSAFTRDGNPRSRVAARYA